MSGLFTEETVTKTRISLPSKDVPNPETCDICGAELAENEGSYAYWAIHPMDGDEVEEDDGYLVCNRCKESVVEALRILFLEVQSVLVS